MQVHLGRKVSTDAFGWVLPQGDQLTVGVATATRYGRRVWDMLAELKKRLGTQLDGAKSQGREAFCYPLAPRPRLAYDRVLLVGDAAGLVAPAVRDGLFFACKSAQLAANVVIRHQNLPMPERLAEYESDWNKRQRDVLAGYAKLEQTFFGADRQREALVDLVWDREIQRQAVEAYLTKRRFAPALGVALRLKAMLAAHMVKYRMINPKKLETDMVSRALPPTPNYLDLALQTKDHELTSVVPEAARPVEH